MSGTKCGRHTQARYSLSGSIETEIKWNENIMSSIEELYNCYSRVEKWSQVAERLGNRASNLKVASSIPGRAE